MQLVNGRKNANAFLAMKQWLYEINLFLQIRKIKAYLQLAPFQIPTEEKVLEFFAAVDNFFEDDGNDDKLLGVHSTFGGNRL